MAALEVDRVAREDVDMRIEDGWCENESSSGEGTFSSTDMDFLGCLIVRGPDMGSFVTPHAGRSSMFVRAT